MKKNQEGFGAVEGLLVVIIVVLLGLVGWLAWHKNSGASNSSSKSGSGTSSAATTQSTAEPTAGWIVYSSAKGKFSLKYPSTWVTASNPEFCSGDIILLGPNSSSVGKCGSDSFGEIFITSSDGDNRATYDLSSSLYVDITSKDVSVEGVSGQRQTGTSKDTSGSVGIGSVPDGTKAIVYTFFTNNKTYVVEYLQRPSDPDAQSDFELLVTKTLKFSS